MIGLGRGTIAIKKTVGVSALWTAWLTFSLSLSSFPKDSQAANAWSPKVPVLSILKAQNAHSQLTGDEMRFELCGIIHWQTPTEPYYDCNSTGLWITCWNQWDNEPAQDYTCADVSLPESRLYGGE